MYALKFTEGKLAGSFYIHRMPSLEGAFLTKEILYPRFGHCAVYHLGDKA